VSAVYNLLLCVAVLIAAPFALAWLVVSSRGRVGLRERLSPLPEGRTDIWLHAASVGEAEAVAPLVPELARRGLSVVATTQTVTGRDRLRRLCPGLLVRLAPIDFGPLVRRSFTRVAPRVLVLVETELWPNLVLEGRRAGAAVVLVSGRVSDRSFPRYRRAARLLRPILHGLAAVGARSAEDGRRFVALGLPPDRLTVVGDLKLDRPAPPSPTQELCVAVGPGPILLAGSTHPGEEVALLDAWARLRARTASKLRLVLAPRHVERSAAVLELVRGRGTEAALRTHGAAAADVVVLDTIGELASLYSVADVVFCGGSLVPIGGHNLLEPVRAGKVVVHGPHVENQRTQVEVLRPLGVLHPVADASELDATLQRLWKDKDRNEPARAAIAVLDGHRGAGARTLDLITGQLGERRVDA
jgi:3-deoxy-D-manno-octulosonic-acid transferase